MATEIQNTASAFNSPSGVVSLAAQLSIAGGAGDGRGHRIAIAGISRGATGTSPRACVNGVPAQLLDAENAIVVGVDPNAAILELRGRRVPSGGTATINVYWPTWERSYASAVEIDGACDRPLSVGAGEALAMTQVSGTAISLGLTATANDSALFAAVGVCIGSTLTETSGQTAFDYLTSSTFISCESGYEEGLASGATSADWTAGSSGTRAAAGCVIAPRDQAITAYSPTNGATGVSPSVGTLELTLSATAVAGTGNFYVCETVAATTAASVVHRTGSTSTGSATPGLTTPGHATNGGGGISAGDLLIFWVGYDLSGGIQPPDGWNWLLLPGSNVTSGMWMWRFADGSEGATTTLTPAATRDTAWRGWQIRGHHPTDPPYMDLAAFASPTAAPDSPSVSVPLSEPLLALAGVSVDGNSTVTGFPASFGDTGSATSANATTGSRVAIGYAERTVTASSVDPSAWTVSSQECVAGTLLVRPAPAHVVVETVPVGSCTFTGVGVDIPVGTLSGSTGHHVKWDDQAIVGVGANDLELEWTFETGAGGGATEDLDGASAGSASASGELSVETPLSGSSDGAATASGALDAQAPLGGTSTGSATGTGDLAATVPLDGSSSGTGGASGDLDAGVDLEELDGSAAGSATTSGELAVSSPLSGAADGTGSAAGELDAATGLAGTADGEATTTGDLGASVSLGGTSAGIATVSGSLLDGDEVETPTDPPYAHVSLDAIAYGRLTLNPIATATVTLS